MSAARHTLLILCPPVLLAIAFAPALLAAWLGGVTDDLAWAARILAGGVLINALVHAPYAALLAANRPDVPARAHVLELLIYLPIALVLVRAYGVSGAAAAWTLRIIVDGAILAYFARRLAAEPVRFTPADGASILLLGGLAVALLVASAASTGVATGIVALALAAYAAGSWYVALLPEERVLARRAFGSSIALSSPR